MATRRNKRKADEVRHRTAVRKVVRKIRRLESDFFTVNSREDISMEEYWVRVASGLSVSELELAVNHVNRYNASDNWYGRVDLFHVMEEALKTALLEKTLGLKP